MKLKLIACALSLSLLSGCAFERINHENDTIDHDFDNARKVLNKAEKGETVSWVNTPYVNKTPVSENTLKTRLPDCPFSLVVSASDLYKISQQITRTCGIPVHIAAELTAGSGNIQTGIPTGIVQGAIPLPTDHGKVPLDTLGAVSSPVALPQSSLALTGIRWNSPELNRFLDMLASRLGIAWGFEGGAINFFATETRTFQVSVLNTDFNTQSRMSSGTSSTEGSGGGNSAGGVSGSNASQQTASINYKSNFYTDIDSAVKTMLSVKGRYFLSPATGTLTVTDTPQSLARIADYIDGQNEKLNKQVLLKVQILSFTKTSGDDASIDWNLVYKAGVGAGLISTPVAGTPDVQASINILDGNFAGSSLFLKALSQQGKVKVLKTQMDTTTNLIAATVQAVKQTGYVQQNSTTATAQVGTQTSMVAGSVITGFNLTLLPYILEDNNHVRLQISLNLSDPPDIQDKKNKDGTVELQLPDITSNSLARSILLKSGQTVIMSGSIQDSNQTKNQGTLSPYNILFGGGASRSDSNTILVVMVSPVIINN
jgi:type IVB pilus formation R64 PilN family outer membrane protein